MEKQKKQRLDVLLVEKGLAPSREKAKAIIMAGIVYVDGNKEDKAGTTFPENAMSVLRPADLRIVCCKTERQKSTQLMSDMDSLRGSFAMTSG